MAGAMLAGGAATTRAASSDNLETAVLAEINYARTHPAAYAETLRRRDPSDWRRDDQGDDYAMPSQSARSEAIAFLDRQPPLSPLGANRGLAGAASRLAEEQARSGRVGHTSALRERFEAHGVWSGMVAETISYGMESPAAVVQQLIIDEGVPGRGHRGVLFDPSLSVAGVGCGPHRTYGRMCVIDFAGAVVKR
jgi:hypothetical protein